MSFIKERCRERGIELPVVSPRGLYKPVQRHGDVLYLSGQVSRIGDSVVAGPVDDLSADERALAGRTAALRALAVIDAALAEGEHIRILKLLVYAYTRPDFKDHPSVGDAVSSVLLDVLGQAGSHSRTAVGVASLPSGGAVEIDLICAVEAARD